MRRHSPRHPSGSGCAECDRTREMMRVVQARHAKTAKGRATHKRYERSERGLYRGRVHVRKVRNAADQRKLDALIEGSQSG